MSKKTKKNSTGKTRISSNPGCPCGNQCETCPDNNKTTKKKQEKFPQIPNTAYCGNQPT